MVADFGKKGNKDFFNDKLLFKTVGIVFLVIIFALIVADFKIYQRKRELTSQINTYKKQIEDIKKNSQTLKNEITNSDNVDYLEKLAYEQLGQQRPGEKEIIFIAPEKKSETVSKPANFWDIRFWTGWMENTFQWIKNKF